MNSFFTSFNTRGNTQFSSQQTPFGLGQSQQYIPQFQSQSQQKRERREINSLIAIGDPIVDITSEIDTENSNFSVPYPTFKKSYLFQNNFENFFSGSENSYSSTYNSSSRTKLFSENTIRHHPLLSNNNISMYKKYTSNISRNFINKIYH